MIKGSTVSPVDTPQKAKILGAESFRADQEEARKHNAEQEDSALHSSSSERVAYALENIISVVPNFPLLLLLAVSILLIVVLGMLWSEATQGDDDLTTGIYTAFQVIASGGNDDSITGIPKRSVYVGSARGVSLTSHMTSSPLTQVCDDDFLGADRLFDPRRLHHRHGLVLHGRALRRAHQGVRVRSHADSRVERGDAAPRVSARVSSTRVEGAE
jgi:hypothetical protein